MRIASRVALVAAVGLAAAVPAWGQSVHATAAPAAVNWGPVPPFLAPGARFAVMQGDPSQAGVYTIRLELPAGYVIKPHFHPTEEDVTVLSGTFVAGMGDAVDEQHATVFSPGGFIAIPAEAHHFAVARTNTVVQVHGMGPFAITYLNAADDPRTATPNR
jgi:quercetin dioxygenase-like cupin family protein